MGVMPVLALLGVLGVGAFAMRNRGSARPRGATRRVRGSARRAGSTCAQTPQWASQASSETIVAWVDCPERTAADIVELSRLLRAGGRDVDARASEQRWNARRAVEDAPPDGALTPQGASEAAAQETPEEPRPFGEASEAASGLAGDDSGLAGSGYVPPPEHLPEREREPGDTTIGPYWRFGDPQAPAGAYTPETLNQDRARAMAGRVARAIENSHEGNRPVRLIREFQRYAGIRADGLYGGRTWRALEYYGVRRPPPTYSPPTKDRVIYVPPIPREDTRS